MIENLVIASGRSNIPLAKKIAKYCGVPYTEINFKTFGDGDWKPKFPETIRGYSVVVVQPTNPIAKKHMGEHLYELLAINDAAMRASAKEVIAVIPYYGGARQDRKDEPRVPITARLNADLITNAGIKKVITLDLHVDQIQGFFSIPVDNLYGSYCFIPAIKQHDLPNMAIASADVGGARRAESYAKYLGLPLIICYKNKVDGKIEKLIPLGDVKGKNIWLLDDIVDSAKTITIAANTMLDMGAASVRACCSHPVLSGNSQKRIDDSGINEFYVLDTIKFRKKSKKIQVLCTAELFGEAIKEHKTPGGSISKLFLFGQTFWLTVFRKPFFISLAYLNQIHINLHTVYVLYFFVFSFLYSMNYPKHVAIVPDGNRTRAKENNKTVAEAYMISYERAVELIQYTFTKTDVKVFTLRGLSTENAKKRPKEEYDFLMSMYKIVEEDLDEFMAANKINFKPIGDLSGITDDFREYLLAKQTRNTYDSDRYFVFAINYGGRDEIVRGVQNIAKTGKDMTTITEEDISGALDLGNVAPIELVIRTKGDQAQRTSGFMSRWIGYAELYFTAKKFPEFNIPEFEKALIWFNEMADLRNYGK